MIAEAAVPEQMTEINSNIIIYLCFFYTHVTALSWAKNE